jgi:hypothetical protein
MGNGTLAQLDISGRISPGGAGIATLTVDNLSTNQETGLPGNTSRAQAIAAAAIATTPDIVFRAGSIFAVDLAASGAGDRINATGTATLEGGTVAITTLDADLAYTDGAIFRILNAEGGLTGTFAGLTESSAFLDFALGYDPTGAFLTLSQIRLFPDVALTINQRAAASALGTLVRPVGSDGLAVYNAVLGLDEDAARAAFDASSGEIYASLLAARQRQGFALASRFASRAQADLREGLGVWGGITGHDGRIDADDDRNAGRVSSDGVGGELGLDYRGERNDWAAGVGGGWQDGNVNLPRPRHGTSVAMCAWAPAGPALPHWRRWFMPKRIPTSRAQSPLAPLPDRQAPTLISRRPRSASMRVTGGRLETGRLAQRPPPVGRPAVSRPFPKPARAP